MVQFLTSNFPYLTSNFYYPPTSYSVFSRCARVISETPVFGCDFSYPMAVKNSAGEHCLAGSLTGEVAAQKVTAACNRLAWYGWKSYFKGKPISQLDCEAYKPNSGYYVALRRHQPDPDGSKPQGEL